MKAVCFADFGGVLVLFVRGIIIHFHSIHVIMRHILFMLFDLGNWLLVVRVELVF